MKELVEFLARALVEDPDSVRVSVKETQRAKILKLRVAQDDVGRVIGKGGRVANAMRSLLRASSSGDERQIILDID